MLINIAQAAKELGVSVITMRRWVSTGILPHYRLGKVIRFDQDELHQWLQKHKKEGKDDK